MWEQPPWLILIIESSILLSVTLKSLPLKVNMSSSPWWVHPLILIVKWLEILRLAILLVGISLIPLQLVLLSIVLNGSFSIPAVRWFNIG